MEHVDLLLNIKDFDEQSLGDNSDDGLQDVFPSSAAPMNIDKYDESKVEQLLAHVRAQYNKLEAENTRLIQLSHLIKGKLDRCTKQEEGCVDSSEPFSHPLVLDIKYNVEEEEDED